ncbi:NADH-quinone oxidoreductase subunit NuoK [candidate division BRC1 bacterium HGW-BRC1-1]|jgi:NADH-quinone oxidoreductase subunit K|nr:MAG: NADH-quinone oxidoreductase subunit NuoK [candidate division BRC1 bacterium HGW-BRC1-1]
MGPIGLQHYLVLGAILFVLGVIGIVSRKNAVGILISIELMLNAANINLIAFSRYSNKPIFPTTMPEAAYMDGQVFAIFVIILAACEAAVALAIILNLFNMFGTIEVDDADTMRG